MWILILYISIGGQSVSVTTAEYSNMAMCSIAATAAKEAFSQNATVDAICTKK